MLPTDTMHSILPAAHHNCWRCFADGRFPRAGGRTDLPSASAVFSLGRCFQITGGMKTVGAINTGAWALSFWRRPKALSLIPRANTMGKRPLFIWLGHERDVSSVVPDRPQPLLIHLLQLPFTEKSSTPPQSV